MKKRQLATVLSGALAAVFFMSPFAFAQTVPAVAQLTDATSTSYAELPMAPVVQQASSTPFTGLSGTLDSFSIEAGGNQSRALVKIFEYASNPLIVAGQTSSAICTWGNAEFSPTSAGPQVLVGVVGDSNFSCSGTGPFASTTDAQLDPTKWYQPTISNVAFFGGGPHVLTLFGDFSQNFQYELFVRGGNAQSFLTATSSSLFSGMSATSTLAALNGQCSQSGNIFAEALCVSFSFLFIPDPSTLSSFSTLPQLAEQHFPFSWLAQVQSTWAALSASSTLNEPSYAYNFHDLGIGSTTPLGNILPNVSAFSSSTISSGAGLIQVPSWFFPDLRGLASLALILTLVADIFFATKHELQKH